MPLLVAILSSRHCILFCRQIFSKEYVLFIIMPPSCIILHWSFSVSYTVLKQECILTLLKQAAAGELTGMSLQTAGIPLDFLIAYCNLFIINSHFVLHLPAHCLTDGGGMQAQSNVSEKSLVWTGLTRVVSIFPMWILVHWWFSLQDFDLGCFNIYDEFCNSIDLVYIYKLIHTCIFCCQRTSTLDIVLHFF